MPGCGNCDRPVPDGAEICTTCADALMHALLGVPDLIEHLVITLTKQDRLGLGRRQRGQLSEAPLPVRFDVGRVIDALSNEMTTWARDVVDRHGCDVPNPPRRSAHNGTRGVVFPTSSPAVDLACYAATWLAEHVGQLRMHPAALEAHRALTGAIAAAEMAIDRPERQLYIGDCGPCAGPVYAPVDATGTRCQRCGAHVADLTQRWDMAKRRLRGYPATAADIAGWIAEIYGVTVDRKLINSWHHRRPFSVVDLDPKTKDPRFRIGDVLDRAAKSERRKAG